MHTLSSGEAANLKQNENELHSHSDLGKFDRGQKRKQASAASDTHIDKAAKYSEECRDSQQKVTRQREEEEDSRNIQPLL